MRLQCRIMALQMINDALFTMTKILTIQNSDGIHARPASLFSTTANNYVSEIQIGRIGEKKINAKSIILLLSLGLKQGEKVEISACGVDGQAAL